MVNSSEKFSLVFAFVFPFAGTAISEDAEKLAAPEEIAFFEKRIRPILAEHCYECHSEEAGKRKGGLWLDRKSGWKIGGDSGPAIAPGDPDESLLIQSIRYHDPDLEMPPEEKLTSAVVANFEEWVRRGAHDPRSGEAKKKDERLIDIEEGRKFWSFQPIENPEPPKVGNADWPKDAIDRFILAKLEANRLTPAEDADKESLLRRITISLTGLPPAVTEQDAFLADTSGTAFEKVVDRLLASDAFAERWGRHWLDIMRYADTSGGGRAMALPDAWRFRDFVVDSFRKDKPLDQLIREHIAGDRLPAETDEERMEKLIGTGFLVLGPHNYENQDKDLLVLEIVDEQLDTIGRAFLGMTIGCARCHDHKFDPIPTRDYYAMAGIFTSTKSVIHSNVSKWYTQPYFPTPEQALAIAKFEKEAEPLEAKRDALKKEILRLGQQPGGAASAVKAVAVEEVAGIFIDDTEAERTGDWQDSDHTAAWVGAGYIHDQNESGVEKSVVWRLPVNVAGRYEVRISYSANTNRASNVPVTVVHADGESTVRIDQRKKPQHAQLFQTVGTYSFAAGKTEVRITNDQTDGVVIADAVQLLPAGEKFDSLTDAKPAKSDEDVALLAKLQKEYKAAEARLKQITKEKPVLASVMAVGELDDPADTQIRVRGMTRNFGEVAPRGFLRVAHSGSRPKIESGSGRLELANWVASPENPLTARVLANRIWQHLFGEGIVASPDNFGITGRAPTHPELLDHLATRLIANDWSAKKMIREIVLTRTWQMSSESNTGIAGVSPAPDPASTKTAGVSPASGPDSAGEARANPNDAGETPAIPEIIDPENQLLSRANRRKVDAETFRDSVLFLAGNLDNDHGGPSLPKGFKSEFGYQFTSLKRSVYLPVFRNQPHEIFAAFDFANPNFVVGKRGASNIPTQSLFLMNSPFIHEQAEAAAKRLLESDADSDEDRVRLAYRETLSRPPQPDELKLSLDFLRSEGATAESDSPAAWTALMRTLFSCVDFQYIR